MTTIICWIHLGKFHRSGDKLTLLLCELCLQQQSSRQNMINWRLRQQMKTDG